MKKNDFAKCLLLFFLFACFHEARAQDQQVNYQREMELLEDKINNFFFIPATGYYKETSLPEKNSRPVSYLWPLCAMLDAANEIGKVKDNTELLNRVRALLDKYYDDRAPAPGYASYAVEYGGGDRFYDDNQWIGITAMDVYKNTGAKEWIGTAEQIYKFMMTGYDKVSGGGFYWQEGEKTKNTCSNGPAIILSLELYKATKKKQYLRIGEECYQWVNQTLKAPSGIYYDAVNVKTGVIDKRMYSYNAGTMLHSAVLLYEITGKTEYLQDAENIAAASLAYFFKDGKFRDNYWFNAVLLRGYIQYMRVSKSADGIMQFKKALDHALVNDKNAKGLLGIKKEVNLVGQAGMLEILARMALLQKEGIFS
ncbi:MAG TPA: glycoside hydrolase family 76 protein [Niabella sp.]|nr:glycoside hydrolase family 76 protein [Niabella sp.]